MQTTLIHLALTAVLTLPCLAFAKQVTLSTELANYQGNAAYLVLYLTKADGEYQKTLWIAGKKSKYYKHLRDWARGSDLSDSEYDGLTGASVRSGKTFEVTVEVPDTMIDSNHQIRIDTAVEDKKEYRAEVIVPLTNEGAGKTVSGRGYVKSFTYSF